MIREIINFLPFWWLLILTMGALLLIGYIAARISAHLFSRPADDEQRHLANSLIGILSGGFSILLAFVIITSWDYLLAARLATAKEADSISLLLHNIAVFPKNEQDKLRAAIRDYAVAVRVDEWQTMREGYASPKAWNAIESLYTQVQAYQHQGSQEKIFYERLLIDLNSLLQSRRERLNKIDSVIPTHLCAALILGSVMLIVVLGAIRGEKKIFYIMPLMFFAIALGFNLGLALSFDFPFSGDIAVSNQPFYEGVLGRLSEQ